MLIVLSFLFFCATGLFFGQALRRRRAVVALAGLISVLLAVVLYLESESATDVDHGGLADFVLPYAFFVCSAIFFGKRSRTRPIAFAIAGLSAIAFAVLVAPEMYRSLEWVYRRPAGDTFHFAQPVFTNAKLAIRWAIGAASSGRVFVPGDETLLNTLVGTMMGLLFVMSGLASRLFVLIGREGASPMRSN